MAKNKKKIEDLSTPSSAEDITLNAAENTSGSVLDTCYNCKRKDPDMYKCECGTTLCDNCSTHYPCPKCGVKKNA